MLKENFNTYIGNSFVLYRNRIAFTDIGGNSMTYEEVTKRILGNHLFFRGAGIVRGDRIAIAGHNSSLWAVTFLSVVSYGAVAVPLLPDFMSADVETLIQHSESRLLFASDTLYHKIDPAKIRDLSGVVSLDNYKILWDRTGKLEDMQHTERVGLTESTETGFEIPAIVSTELKDSDPLVIFYTSGTTGFSKGVVLSAKNLAANLGFAHRHMQMNPGDPMVSFMPLAHSFGCAFEFLCPFSFGCHIHFVTSAPSSKTVLDIFRKVRPRLILTVPLLVEKLYRGHLQPVLSRFPFRQLARLPLAGRLAERYFLKKTREVFGGQFREVIVGGAPLDRETEAFFRKIGLPLTVGYGMAECGPLISYSSWNETRTGSCGRPVDTLELKILSDDPQNIPGEILVRGDNVMLGYFKDKRETAKTLDKEGWLHTGDLGTVDREGFLFIRGRVKNMILGPSGKNIYPEEIEFLLTRCEHVEEALVLERKGKVWAWLVPESHLMTGKTLEELDHMMGQCVSAVNEKLPPYKRIRGYNTSMDYFVRTPKNTIRRFLYS